MNFDQAFDRLIGHEGGYANSPSDPGGETMWGVTKNVARANGYEGSMMNLPRDTAKAIYRKQYWNAIQADKLPEALRFHVFDAAVNSGNKQAVKWLQRAADTGFPCFPFFERDPLLDPMRRHPEFIRLFDRLRAAHEQARPRTP